MTIDILFDYRSVELAQSIKGGAGVRRGVSMKHGVLIKHGVGGCMMLALVA